MKAPNWLIGLLVLLGLLRRRREDGDDAGEPRERIVAPGQPAPRAELVVVALLLLAALAAAGFVVAYGLGASTQVLGGTLAGALALFAAALIVAAKRLVVSEELPEEYPDPHPDESQAVAQIVRESGSRLTRKRLLFTAAGVAGTALGGAFVAPAVSLGPLFDSSPMYRTPWRRGRRLVDEHGLPMTADDIVEASFFTAYPEGADKKDLGAPLVLVRMDPAALELPTERKGWAPEGILAFSKICTHAGCAIALYRYPKVAPTQKRPALVCPCHYSTFDPAKGAEVIFGPAGRPLPQLPLMIGTNRQLVAAGNYSGPVGPSWSGVRSHRAR
ncbi:MAG: ubiquinol-cytochrome c reductase iron-sulfur subunit [Gaiellaceae bacterium]